MEKQKKRAIAIILVSAASILYFAALYFLYFKAKAIQEKDINVLAETASYYAYIHDTKNAERFFDAAFKINNTNTGLLGSFYLYKMGYEKDVYKNKINELYQKDHCPDIQILHYFVNNIRFTSYPLPLHDLHNKINYFRLIRTNYYQIKKNEAEDSFINEFKKLGIYFYKNNFIDAGEEALKIFLDNRTNNEVLVWYGSLLTKKGDVVKNARDKINYVRQGLSVMDSAVQNFPDNYTIRIIRANTIVQIPLFFRRIDTAVEDLDYIMEKALKNEKMYIDHKTEISIGDSKKNYVYELLMKALSKKGNKEMIKKYKQKYGLK